MNEPHRGYVDLLSPYGFDFNTDLAIGYFPTAVQSFVVVSISFRCRFLRANLVLLTQMGSGIGTRGRYRPLRAQLPRYRAYLPSRSHFSAHAYPLLTFSGRHSFCPPLSSIGAYCLEKGLVLHLEGARVVGMGFKKGRVGRASQLEERVLQEGPRDGRRS